MIVVPSQLMPQSPQPTLTLVHRKHPRHITSSTYHAYLHGACVSGASAPNCFTNPTPPGDWPHGCSQPPFASISTSKLSIPMQRDLITATRYCLQDDMTLDGMTCHHAIMMRLSPSIHVSCILRADMIRPAPTLICRCRCWRYRGIPSCQPPGQCTSPIVPTNKNSLTRSLLVQNSTRHSGARAHLCDRGGFA
jgi:hypothetical protein